VELYHAPRYSVPLTFNHLDLAQTRYFRFLYLILLSEVVRLSLYLYPRRSVIMLFVRFPMSQLYRRIPFYMATCTVLPSSKT
jgi:hypothetical protein